MEKTIVCRCEDITYEDVITAIEEGYDDLESLKRRLRLGMGPCQGRTCMPIVLRILAQKTRKKREEIPLPTHRPPATPLPFGIFAQESEEEKNEK